MDWQNLLLWTKGGVQGGSKGALIPASSDPLDGALMVKQGGKYSNAALNGRVFGVCNQAAVAVTAKYAATWTGLGVGNPPTSGVNAVLLNFAYGNTIEGISVGTVGIMAGIMGICPIVKTLEIQNQKLDGPQSVLCASAGQTINAAPAPTLLRVCGITGTGAVTTWQTQPCTFDIDGAIVIPPGHFWAAYCFALAAASLQFSFMWEEVPV